MLLKQEERRLKEQDMLENYRRKKKQDQYKLMKYMDKKKRVQEKLAFMKQRQEFMKKARMYSIACSYYLFLSEAQIQAKIERERIMNNINTATKKLAMKEFMNTYLSYINHNNPFIHRKSKKDMRLYKLERKKAKNLLGDILNPLQFQEDFIDKKKEDEDKKKNNN